MTAFFYLHRCVLFEKSLIDGWVKVQDVTKSLKSSKYEGVEQHKSAIMKSKEGTNNFFPKIFCISRRDSKISHDGHRNPFSTSFCLWSLT